jgi:hypothetical protein
VRVGLLSLHTLRRVKTRAIGIDYRKFTRVVNSLRSIINGYNAVSAEICLAINGPRSRAEIDLLESIDNDCTSLQEKSQALLEHLFNAK